MSLDLFSAPEEDRQRTQRKPKPGENAPERPARESLSPASHDISALSTLRVGQARPGDEWTVSQVNDAARELVEGIFPPLWVSGEVTNFTRARSGHCYFTLRDRGSQLRCVMWRDDARRLPAAPTEGMEVRAFGRLTVYQARGSFQLTVTQVEAKGEGLWKLALERLRAKLEAEGLTAPARKRALPRHPAAVGVVTSPSGAVFQDICTVVRRRAPWTRLVLAGCRVQGDGAALEIAAAIRLIGSRGGVDVIIVGRGGGSIEDLWAFNDERVARAIASSPVPVVSAVGHETDVTIADLVADHRAPTPSAAAEAVVPDREELARNLQRDGWRLSRALAGRLARAQEAVEYASAQLAACAGMMITDRRERVRLAARQLEALSPLAAFARGYAVPLSAEGRILRRQADFEPGEAFDLKVRDGVVPCRTRG